MGGSPKNIILFIIFSMLGGAFIVGILLAALSIHAASAHEWYPVECCSSRDCHVVDKAYWKGGVMTVEVGKDVVAIGKNVQWRQSPDGQYHVCYTNAYDAPHVYCFFVPGDA